MRGPAALLYGGNATGGVVNLLDNRIPKTPASGLSSSAELRLGGAANERAGAVVLDGGAGAMAWHADAIGRRTDDLRVPLHTPVQEGLALAPSRRVRNSAAAAEGGAVGAGWVGRDGYLGVSVDTLRNDYGVTVEPDVTIRLQRERVALGGEWRSGSGFVHSFGGQASATRYRHEEVEGSGDVGTTLKSRGRDLRLEMRHAPVAGIEGVWGLQAETLNFSALGEEAFVPGTRTRSQALFVLEEWAQGPWSVSAGARAEQVQLSSAGDASGAATLRFGDAAPRRFTPGSWSLSLGAQLPGSWQLLGTLGSTQRAPAYYELYANGLHLATAAFEVGDPQMALEKSRHAELGLVWKRGDHHVKASLYQTRFGNFIALDATGVNVVVPGEAGEPDTALPGYRFQGVRARLQGFELEGGTRLLQRGPGGMTVDLSGSIDRVLGDNLTRGEPLPRLSPPRARIGMALEWPSFTTGADLRHAARQTRFGADDTATPAYTMLNLWARGRFTADGGLGWFAKLGNVTDELARNAASVAAVRGLSPLAGRALAVGVNASG